MELFSWSDELLKMQCNALIYAVENEQSDERRLAFMDFAAECAAFRKELFWRE